MEDSLRREDVETMSRENMKNLHEIMQVASVVINVGLIGIKSINTKPEPSLLKVQTLSQNIQYSWDFLNCEDNIQKFEILVIYSI